jgi:GGDEF domain-containing protein
VRYHVLVISDITEQRVQRERLERQAHFDELTRLPNRARLSQLLADAMRAADRDGYLLAVCYLDLDRFKPVNDRFGHAAGDRLLIELAGRLRSALRTRDTWADTAARLGGDEFVLLLRAGPSKRRAWQSSACCGWSRSPTWSTRPRSRCRSPPAWAPRSTRSTAATPTPCCATPTMRCTAPSSPGRNGYLFFDPEHRRRTEERVMAIGRVQEALDQAEFVLFYQPKVDMRSRQGAGLRGPAALGPSAARADRAACSSCP